MANYTGIQGQNILIVDTDPANPTEGQIWYNTTSNLLKGYQFAAINSWASGGNLNTGRQNVAGTGILTAGLAFGGTTPSVTGATELYNGTSWTSNPTGLNTARYNLGAAGTQTAALGFGGEDPLGPNTAVTELWNGASWTSNPTGLNTSRSEVGGFGISTAAVAAGGASAPTRTGATEEFDGTSWASGNPMSPARGNGGTCGTLTAGLFVGGIISPSPPSNRSLVDVSEYNGTSWTAGGNLPVGKSEIRAFGTQTAAIGAGGYIPSPAVYVNTAQEYNGTAWTSLTNLPRSTGANAAGGNTTNGFLAGGVPVSTTTDEWAGTVLATRTITTS
jgi:hypothetical protein